MKEQVDIEPLPALPELNLYNFEDDDFSGTKYVLTSPRSLEACDMLNIRPMELLYKPLSDFQDEMREKGLSFHDAYVGYDNYEKDRQRKLRECRDYRDKMIRDSMFKQTDYVDVDGLAADEPVSLGRPVHVTNVTNGSVPALQLNKYERLSGHDEHWRTYPPYSERHLARHDDKQSGGISAPYTHTERQPSNRIREEIPISTRVWDEIPQPVYKSQFMRRQMMQELKMSPDFKQIASRSLPTHAAPRDHNTYLRNGDLRSNQRSNTRHRTSTPLDINAGRDSVMDKAFTGLSTIDPSSPRSRTRSAHAQLGNEIIQSNLPERSKLTQDNFNVTGRSLSLTDLTNLVDADRDYQVNAHQKRSHRRGLSSDLDYMSSYPVQKSSLEQNADDIISRALDRRQREIEENLLQEELNYKEKLKQLKDDMRHLDLDHQHFENEVDDLRHDMYDNKWRTYYHHSSDSGFKDNESITPRYYRENAAEQAQRERRLDLLKQQAEAEFDAKVTRSRAHKSRLKSDRYKKAFDRALVINKEKWQANAPSSDGYNGDNFLLTNDEITGYEHIAEVLKRNQNDKNDKYISSKYRHVNNWLLDKDVEYAKENGVTKDEPILTEEVLRQHDILNSSNERDEMDAVDEFALLNGHFDDRIPQRHPRYLNEGILDERENLADELELQKNGRENNYRRECLLRGVRNPEDLQGRVKKIKANLEERRRKLNDKLQETARQTQELRAARLESERKERLRRQEKANKRVVRDRSSNRRKLKQDTSVKAKGRLVEKVHPLRTNATAQSHFRTRDHDTFDKKVLRAELNNWVNTGQRSRHRTRSATRNESQITLA